MHMEGLEYREVRQLVESQQETFEQLAVLRNTISDKKLVELPYQHGFVGLLDGSGVLFDRALDYLEDRGFDIEYLHDRGFGVCLEQAENKDEDFFGRIIIPFYRSGVLHFYIGRTFVGDFLRYKTPKKDVIGVGSSEVIYNEDGLHRNRKVYVNEGWADAEQYGDKGVATLGWSWSARQFDKLTSGTVKTFVLVPDKGAYKGAVQHAMKLFDFGKVKVLDIESAGLTKYGKDTNEIGVDRMLDLEDRTPFMDLAMAVDELMR